MPIMSVLILVLNLYARSATESQVIIDLILSFNTSWSVGA